MHTHTHTQNDFFSSEMTYLRTLNSLLVEAEKEGSPSNAPFSPFALSYVLNLEHKSVC